MHDRTAHLCSQTCVMSISDSQNSMSKSGSLIYATDDGDRPGPQLDVATGGGGGWRGREH